MTSTYRQRSAFEKQLLAELGTRLKRSSWKKSQCALFRQSGTIYQDLFVSVHRNAALTNVELRFKPMALDPILWDILDIPENREKPIAFRTWGAFTCPSLPVFATQVEQPGDNAGDVANRLVQLCADSDALLQPYQSVKPFSELVADHANQTERGAYAVTLVASLIVEGKLDLAFRTASAYATGELSSCHSLASNGKSFHQLALEWLEAGRLSGVSLQASAVA